MSIELDENIRQENISAYLQKNAHHIRQDIISALHSVGGGHYGGALSVTDILVTLYMRVINLTQFNFNHPNRDRVVLSKGHAAIALYCILKNLNIIDNSLSQYGFFESGLEGHPDMQFTPGIDFSSGSLGQGLSVGLGMALGLKNKSHVWIVLGDGECQEGQIWEAAMLASRYRVANLHAIIDSNNAQECGYKYNHELPQEPITLIQEKWQSFGWDTQIIDGHNFLDIENACQQAKNISDKPSVIIAKTSKGRGVHLFEKNPEKYHCTHLTDLEYQIALKELAHYATAR